MGRPECRFSRLRGISRCERRRLSCGDYDTLDSHQCRRPRAANVRGCGASNDGPRVGRAVTSFRSHGDGRPMAVSGEVPVRQTSNRPEPSVMVARRGRIHGHWCRSAKFDDHQDHSTGATRDSFLSARATADGLHHSRRVSSGSPHIG